MLEYLCVEYFLPVEGEGPLFGKVEIVDGVHGIELAGEWNQAAQTWTLEVPEDMIEGVPTAAPDALTRNQSWTVVIHVAPNWETGGHAEWGDNDDVDAHFECVGCTPSPPPAPPPSPPPPPPSPPPIEPWCFTGTWGKGEFTKFWGPPWGQHRTPPAANGTLPKEYSIEGSCNHGTVGEQTILSGAKEVIKT